MPRIVFTADLHGDPELYQALLWLGAEVDAAAVVVGGDLLPHAIRSADALTIQRAFVAETLLPLLRKFRTANPTIAVALLPGNDDWAAAVAPLAAAAEVTWIHCAAAPLREWWLAGYGCVPITPFSIKDYERRDLVTDAANPALFGQAFVSAGDTLAPTGAAALAALPSIQDDLARLRKRTDPARTVYITHAPPFDTPLDLARGGRHLGSQAVRSFIERHQPPLTLHGHIHEAPEQSGRWAQRIGRSWCVNVGRDGAGLRAAIIDLADGAVVGMEHTVYGQLALGR